MKQHKGRGDDKIRAYWAQRESKDTSIITSLWAQRIQEAYSSFVFVQMGQ